MSRLWVVVRTGLLFTVLASLPLLGPVARAAPRTSAAAQAVANLDRTIEAREHVQLATKREVAQRDRAVDRWLREELAAIRGDTSDAAISQSRAVVTVATARGRIAVAREASELGEAMIRTRAAPLEPVIAAGRWLGALDQIETWVPGAEPMGRDVKLAVIARVRAAIVAAEARAGSPQERFVYARMHRWLGEQVVSTGEVAAMHALAATNVKLDRAASTRPPARR